MRAHVRIDSHEGARHRLAGVADSVDPAKAAADRLLDLLYTGVGLGVLAVNKAQAARRNAMGAGGPLEGSALAAGIEDFQKLMADPDTLAAVVHWIQVEVRNLDERFDGVEDRIDEALGRLEPDLPEGAQQIVKGLRSLASEHAGQVRSLLGLDT